MMLKSHAACDTNYHLTTVPAALFTMAASITIAHGHGRASLPVRVPHLMPFHIKHTGPAPVSTYFRIRSQDGPSPAPDPPPPGDNQTELTTVTINTEVVLLEEKENAPMAVDADPAIITAAAKVDVVVANVKAPALPVLRSGPIRRLSESAKRFISSFRGRTVHGVEVTLPKGYVGIVLRGDVNDHDHPRPSTASKTKRRRPARGSRRKLTEEEELDEILPEEDDEDGLPVRVLKPTAKFDSFVLWHPDNPVDEGKDEYLRSLSEWTSMASEVRLQVLAMHIIFGLTMSHKIDSSKRGSSDIEDVLYKYSGQTLYTTITIRLYYLFVSFAQRRLGAVRVT
jgi:ribonuclease H2 subunit C